MSSKQDKTWARTAADLERKQNFREVLGIATDARTFAEEAKKKAKEKDIFTVVKSSATIVEETEDEYEEEFDLASGM